MTAIGNAGSRMMLGARSPTPAFLVAVSLAACGGTPLSVDAGAGVGGAGGGSGGDVDGGNGDRDGAACPALFCRSHCRDGVKVNANGCPTCACNPPPSPGPPPSCDATRCPQPAPGAPNFACPDGRTVGGPACVTLANGACGWVFITCPPNCAQDAACVVGAHWDPELCRCVLPCDCPPGEVCVQQIGGPAAQAPPRPMCERYDQTCFQTSGKPCDCLPTAEGSCQALGDRACSCDNGMR